MKIKGKDTSIHTKEFGPLPEGHTVPGEVFRQKYMKSREVCFAFVAFNEVDLKASILTGQQRKTEYRYQRGDDGAKFYKGSK